MKAQCRAVIFTVIKMSVFPTYGTVLVRNKKAVPWNDDSILVVLKLEGEGALLCVLSGRNASAGLRLLNVLHKLKVHIKDVGFPN